MSYPSGFQRRLVAIVFLAFLSSLAFSPRTALALDFMSESRATRRLSDAEIAQLHDPMFALVVSKSPLGSIEQILDLVQPDPSKREVFVVSEEIATQSPSQGESRRTAIGFEGDRGGITLKPNVMLSITIFPSQFDTALVEGWGWDSTLGRYNYYSREGHQGQLSWFFHGSSDDVGKPPQDRGRCLQCHGNGAPLMKELFFPWTNWHGPRFRATYLDATAHTHWPVAESAGLKGSLSTADKLEEDFIVPSIHRFNQARLKRAVRSAEAKKRVLDARILLAPLFKTIEFNLLTSSTLSGMNPFDPNAPGKPAVPVQIPNSFFLNSDLIGGRGGAGLKGLGIADANFSALDELKLTPDDYASLVDESGQHLGSKGGDAIFAWLTPEPSFVDNDMVDALLVEGAITPRFAAAVLSVDLRTPILSTERADLFQFVPSTFEYTPLGAGLSPVPADELSAAVVAALEKRATTQLLTPSQDLLLKRLKSPDPVGLLKADVVSYRNEVKKKLDKANAQARKATLTDLHRKVLERRKRIIRMTIVESEFLLPLAD